MRALPRSSRLLALLAVVGCGDSHASSAPATTAAPASPPVTGAAAVEGALCKEHGVLAAVCTKHNPALVAVFRAKGDFCEEHGFPESFCPICHPERGGRPAADVAASNDGPADGTKVRLKDKDAARRAGLQLAKAEAGVAQREVPATARVVYDASRVAQLNPRVTGVVRALRADVGVQVRAGAALAVIESADVGAEQSRLAAARSRADVAEANHQRSVALRAEGVSSQRALLDAERERDQARAELAAARSALAMIGASADGSARYTLTTPIAGVVTQRNVTIGRLVDSDDTVFEVVDPSVMWLELDVAEVDLALVQVGQQVTVTLDGLPGRELVAKLSYVSPAIDPRTRTTIARAPLPNPDGALRANLFGRARITVADPRAAVWVPSSAVQRARASSVVFVRIADDLFEARRVTVTATDGERASVTGRVTAGDDVVTEGSFLLKTETLKESIGAGCCAGE
jgi:cobalt-zinc-cadmium efflux system membrane fusion protein